MEDLVAHWRTSLSISPVFAPTRLFVNHNANKAETSTSLFMASSLPEGSQRFRRRQRVQRLSFQDQFICISVLAHRRYPGWIGGWHYAARWRGVNRDFYFSSRFPLILSLATVSDWD